MDEARGQSEKKSILLIEDEEAHAMLITRVFEDNVPDWQIIHKTKIGDAKAWLNDHKDSLPDLVISDYKLPDGTGLDLTGDAKSPEELGFPLIILTGVGSEKLAVRSLKSGAMDYVVKNPDDLSRLPETARSTIHKWEMITERKRTEELLTKYISDLESDKVNLEEFIDRIIEELDVSMSTIQEFNNIIMDKYSDKLDEEGKDWIYKVKAATEKADILLDKLFGYLVPVYFDSSLISLYETNLQHIKKKKKNTSRNEKDSGPAE